MSKGALTPRTYPYPMVRISCSKCDRAGRYRQQMLIDHYGPDIAMPDLRHLLAQCPRRGDMHDPCAVIYTDFAASR